MLHLCAHGSTSFLLILKRNPTFIQEAAGVGAAQPQGRAAGRRATRTGFSQTPLAGHLTPFRQRLPPCPPVGPPLPQPAQPLLPPSPLLQGLPLSAAVLATLAHNYRFHLCPARPCPSVPVPGTQWCSANGYTTLPCHGLSLPGLPLRAQDRGRASKPSARKGRAVGGWSGGVGTGLSCSRLQVGVSGAPSLTPQARTIVLSR